MHRLIGPIIIAFFISPNCKGQALSTIIGWNWAFQSSEQLDYVIERYNGTRNFLDEEMQQARIFDGFHIALARANDGFMARIDIETQGVLLEASGEDPSGIEQRRQLKVNTNGLFIGLGRRFVPQFSAGLGISLTTEKWRTRVFPSAEKPPSFEEVDKTLQLGFRPFIESTLILNPGLGFNFKAQYQFNLSNADYAVLNETINPATAAADPSELKGKHQGFGISAGLILILAR